MVVNLVLGSAPEQLPRQHFSPPLFCQTASQSICQCCWPVTFPGVYVLHACAFFFSSVLFC